MGQRPYLRDLSKPLIAAIAFGALAAVLWAVIVSLGLIFDVDAGGLGPVLGLLMVAAVISGGVELTRNRNRWVRTAGATLITAAILLVVGVALVVGFAIAVCGGGACE
jgi:hypothetical protein